MTKTKYFFICYGIRASYFFLIIGVIEYLGDLFLLMVWQNPLIEQILFYFTIDSPSSRGLLHIHKYEKYYNCKY